MFFLTKERFVVTKKTIVTFIGTLFFGIISLVSAQEAIIADHTITGIRRIEDIPLEWIHKARDSLKIMYRGTSHSHQLTCGLRYIMSEYGADYAFHRPRPGHDPIEKEDTLLFFTNVGQVEGIGDCPRDLGDGDNDWWTCTREFLDLSPHINVAFWSWCSGASRASEEQINTYCVQADAIDKDYPDVRFVYMTGHTDGSGYVHRSNSERVPTLRRNNEIIRKFCRDSGKILFDFADIESHSPDGRDMMTLYVNQHHYDTDGDKRADDESNWCREYCETDPDGCYGQKYDDECGHTDPLISQLKGEALWWMLAKMVGWEGFETTAKRAYNRTLHNNVKNVRRTDGNTPVSICDIRGRLLITCKHSEIGKAIEKRKIGSTVGIVRYGVDNDVQLIGIIR
jgi:hypothetical protein